MNAYQFELIGSGDYRSCIREIKMGTSLNLDILIDVKDDGPKQRRGRKKMKETKKKSEASDDEEKPEEVAPLDLAPTEEVPLTITDTLCGYYHKGHLDDPLQAGRLYSVDGAASHYFCMLFTRGVVSRVRTARGCSVSTVERCYFNWGG